jgi:hypothetical protein
MWQPSSQAGLILNVPKELSAKIQAASAPKSDGVSSKVAASGIAQQIVLGSFESSCCLRDAVRAPPVSASTAATRHHFPPQLAEASAPHGSSCAVSSVLCFE